MLCNKHMYKKRQLDLRMPVSYRFAELVKESIEKPSGRIRWLLHKATLTTLVS